MTLYPKLILDALSTVRYPGNGKNIVKILLRQKWLPTIFVLTE